MMAIAGNGEYHQYMYDSYSLNPVSSLVSVQLGAPLSTNQLANNKTEAMHTKDPYYANGPQLEAEGFSLG